MSFAPISMVSDLTLSAYRAVSVTSANKVQYFTASAAPVGITMDEASAAGQAVPIAVGGIAKLYFADSCATGALVAINTAGQGIPLTATTAGTWTIGVLLDAKVEVAGTIARVLVRPQITYEVP